MIGETISHYRIVSKIGEGGMGVVYKARDQRFGRHVALKLLSEHLSADPSLRERFRQEARAASTLNHPNICTIHDTGEHLDRPYLVMELLEGRTLREILRERPMELDECVRVGSEVADALNAAHESGIIHRDVKPENIVVTTDGRAKILDFGLAKLLVEDGPAGETTMPAARHLTRPGEAAGTEAYMSPEQSLGKELDTRSDLFSLGIVLYEMATRQRPFRGETSAAVFDQILNRDPEPLTRLRADLPAELDEIIARALEKRPQDRYQSAAELATDLRRLPGSAVPPHPLRRWIGARPGRRRSRRRWAPIAVALGTGALVTLLILKCGDFDTEGRSLVVLPFRAPNESDDHRALTDGLVETLSARLTLLEGSDRGLWVVPSVEVWADDVTSVTEAREAFDVDLAVTGSIQQVDSDVIVTVNLVDARSLRQKASAVLRHRNEDLVGLQESAARSVARMLEMEYEASAARFLGAGLTGSASAYEVYLRARGYLERDDQEGNVDRAIGLLEEAVGRDPEYAKAFAALARAYWVKFRADPDTSLISDARRAAVRALSLAPELPEAHVALGTVRRGSGAYGGARESFMTALDLDPRDAEALTGLALTLERAGDPEGAEATYLRAIQARPRYWGGYNAIGVFYYDRGRFDDALAAFRKVTELIPGNYQSHNNAGAVLLALGQTDDARESFERSLRAEPNANAYSNLATILFSERDYLNAARTYEAALNQNPRDYEIVRNLGSAYYWGGRRELAREKYRLARELLEPLRAVNERDPWLLADDAYLLTMLGEHAEARDRLDEVVKLSPPENDLRVTIGETYELLGEREQALIWIELALESGYPLEYILETPTFAQLAADERLQKERQQ